MWLWNELAIEVSEFAEENYIQNAMDSHGINEAPEESFDFVPQDIGTVDDIADEEFGSDL
jgi:hypothetical protein